MPQAIIPIGTLAAQSAIAAAIINTLTVILINTALGALEFRDDAGELWIATND